MRNLNFRIFPLKPHECNKFLHYKMWFPVVPITDFLLFSLNYSCFVCVCVCACECLQISAVLTATVIVTGEHLTIFHNLLLLNLYLNVFAIICLKSNTDFHIPI